MFRETFLSPGSYSLLILCQDTSSSAWNREKCSSLGKKFSQISPQDDPCYSTCLLFIMKLMALMLQLLLLLLILCSQCPYFYRKMSESLLTYDLSTHCVQWVSKWYKWRRVRAQRSQRSGQMSEEIYHTLSVAATCRTIPYFLPIQVALENLSYSLTHYQPLIASMFGHLANPYRVQLFMQYVNTPTNLTSH